MRTTLVAMLGLVAAACTGKPAEAPVRSVATPTQGPVPYRASPSAAQAPYVAAAPATTSGGAAASTYQPSPFPPAHADPAPSAAGTEVRWYENIADAQAEARASGKLILVGSTKPGCTLCEKFAHQVAPQCWSRLSQVAVPYMYDIVHYDTKVADNVRVDRALRTNLRGAALMPLVGFLTPDLQWVHGFSGPRSVAEFMGDIESARRIYPVHAAALPQPAPITGPTLAMGTPVATVNEFGDRDWSAPAEWPAPEDALGPVAKMDVTTPAPEPAAPSPTPTPVVAATSATIEPAPVAEPTPTPAAEPTPAPVLAAAAPVPALTAAAPPSGPTWSAPAPMPKNLAVSSTPWAGGPGAPTARIQAPAPPPVVASAPAPSVAPVTVLTPASGTMSESDADAALRQAHASIRAGQFDEARAALRRVSQALPNSAVGREADRGSVAVFNARRIAAANADQRPQLVERAQKDLGATMWADLF